MEGGNEIVTPFVCVSRDRREREREREREKRHPLSQIIKAAFVKTGNEHHHFFFFFFITPCVNNLLSFLSLSLSLSGIFAFKEAGE